MAAGLGHRLGDVLFALTVDRRRLALDNLARAFPELSARAHRDLCRRFYRHLGLTLVELWGLLARPVEDVLKEITLDGLGHLRAVMATRGRALLLSAHLGNWELLGVAHRLTGFPLTTVVRPLDVPWLDALAQRLRRKTGVDLIDKRGAIRPVLAALDRGSPVGILLDQNATRRQAVFVPFFGVAASTSRSVAVLARRSGAPVVPVFIRREAWARHRVLIHPPLEPPPANSGEAGVVDLTRRCTALIETAIRESPDQWLWMHNRWRTRPPVQRA
jgi:KDO2-lipid IV(A) lauroyltransferase